MNATLAPAPRAGSPFDTAPHLLAPPTRPEWERYLAHHGRSFWIATRLIPQPHRARVVGVYAYCRYTDDFVDNVQCAPDLLLGAVNEWETLSRLAYDGHTTGIELLDEVMSDMARGGVPFTHVEELLRGMRADAAGARFANLAELEGYCHDVASVVGLWLTELFGIHDPWTLERADCLGVAMQLTNIVRDVGEDWDRGRLYLPQSLLETHGVTEKLLDELRHGPAPIPRTLATVLEALMTEAERRYALADEALVNLPAFFRGSVAVASRVYAAIHGVVRANGYDSLRRRAVASEASRLSAAQAALRDMHGRL